MLKKAMLCWVVAVASIFAGGCAGDDAAPPREKSPKASEPTERSPERASTPIEGPITTTESGTLIVSGDTAKFCSDYYPSDPPSCGGDSLTVVDVDVEGIPASGTGSGKTWYHDVRVRGRKSGDTMSALEVVTDEIGQ